MGNSWKEYSIILPAKKEYIYDIQNNDTNCVLIRNYNITNVHIGVSPLLYEKTIIPNQIGSIARPYPLNLIYLLADKSTPVDIIETKIKSIDNFIQQQVTKNVIIQNKPKIDVTPLYELFTAHERFFSSTSRTNPPGRTFVYDLGEYGKTNINLHLNVTRAITGIRPLNVSCFCCGTNDNIRFYTVDSFTAFGIVFRTIKNFPYRYFRLFFPGGFSSRFRISFVNLTVSIRR